MIQIVGSVAVIGCVVAGFLKGPGYKRDDYVTLLKLLCDILVKMRKNGVMAIDNGLENPLKSPLIQRYPHISQITTCWYSSPTACDSSLAAISICTSLRACSSTSSRPIIVKPTNLHMRCRRPPTRSMILMTHQAQEQAHLADVPQMAPGKAHSGSCLPLQT